MAGIEITAVVPCCMQVVVQTEKTLAGVVDNVVAFVNDCSKLVKSADLTITSGKAKVICTSLAPLGLLPLLLLQIAKILNCRCCERQSTFP